MVPMFHVRKSFLKCNFMADMEWLGESLALFKSCPGGPWAAINLVPPVRSVEFSDDPQHVDSSLARIQALQAPVPCDPFAVSYHPCPICLGLNSRCLGVCRGHRSCLYPSLALGLGWLFCPGRDAAYLTVSGPVGGFLFQVAGPGQALCIEETHKRASVNTQSMCH